METTNNIDGGTLSISCVDALSIKDKITFYAISLDGVQLTYWFDDEMGNTEERVNRAFDLLFDELVRVENMQI